MEKLLRDITDKEWILYLWIEVTSTRDPDRKFLQVRERTAAEARHAALELRDMRQAPIDEST